MGLMHLITSAAAIAIAAYILPGVEATWLGILVLAVVLGVINTFIKPVVTLLTLPLTIVTLGLFSLVINGALVMLAAYVVPGVFIDGFVTALLFAIIVSLVNALFAPLRWF
ncbi:MAG: phage holin family protein [Candidatus Pacebacteria bacterium]|nr:phage holin family protein [Candidatus Paceibacterota bacterium]